MKLTAQANYVVIKVDTPEEKEHATGLMLPAEKNEMPCYGVVVSAGPYCIVPEFVEGAHVLIPPTGVGIKYRQGQDTYLILLDHEIYGVISE